MKCKNGHEIPPGARFCKDCGGKPHRSMNKRPWLYALVALVVVGASVGVGTHIMINHQDAAVAKVQLQAKVDRDAAAAKAKAVAAKAKADAAAAKATAAAAAAKAKQDAALAKAQKDGADAKKLAQQAQSNPPKIIVQQPPASVNTQPGSGSVSFTAKVASMSSQAAAQQYVPRIEALGYTSQVFFSSNFSHLTPGYWVVGAGPYSTFAEANAAVADLKSISPDAYVRCVGSEASCAGQD